jgi:tight adherence protein C
VTSVILMAVLGSFGATFLVVLTALNAAHARHEARSGLRSLSVYELPANIRDQELLRSLRERLLVPAAGILARWSDRFTPSGYTAAVRQKLIKAGSPGGLDADRFVALKVLGAASGPLWAWLAFAYLALGGFYGVVVTMLLWASSFMAPDVWVDRRIAERQKEIAVRLPDILDLLVISVEAGLGFDQAIGRAVAVIPGALSEEFARMLQETRVGSTRAEALRAVDERTDVPELHTFILALLQADAFGVSIGRMLRQQADDMRVRRRQRAQEAAQKAPVKMLFPLIFCIFPSLFTVILGPAALQIMRSGLA